MRFPLGINQHQKIQTSKFPEHLYVIPVKPWRHSGANCKQCQACPATSLPDPSLAIYSYTESIHQTTKTFVSFFILLRVGSQFREKRRAKRYHLPFLVVTTAENLGPCHRFNCKYYHHHLS